jgi:hypothetical protein
LAARADSFYAAYRVPNSGSFLSAVKMSQWTAFYWANISPYAAAVQISYQQTLSAAASPTQYAALGDPQ